MNRLLTFVFILSIVGWTYSCLKMKALNHRVIKETQDKLHYEKIFIDTEISPVVPEICISLNFRITG